MTVATLGMAGKDAGYFFGGRANRNCRYIICKGEEKRKIKDDSGSSILTTC